MSDKIQITDLVCWGKHGANLDEKKEPQPFEIFVEITADLSLAERSDNLPDTLDYSDMQRVIREIVEYNSFNLLERLAGHICKVLLSDRRVESVTIRIAKPKKLHGATPAILMTRYRQ